MKPSSTMLACFDFCHIVSRVLGKILRICLWGSEPEHSNEHAQNEGNTHWLWFHCNVAWCIMAPLPKSIGSCTKSDTKCCKHPVKQNIIRRRVVRRNKNTNLFGSLKKSAESSWWVVTLLMKLETSSASPTDSSRPSIKFGSSKSKCGFGRSTVSLFHCCRIMLSFKTRPETCYLNTVFSWATKF